MLITFCYFKKYILPVYCYFFLITFQNPKLCVFTVYYAQSNVSAGSWIFLG